MMAKSVTFATTGHKVPAAILEIERINRLALSAGMSYGRYVAMSNMPPVQRRRGKKRAE